MTEHHLAQLNIARLRAPLEDPSMAEFAQNLARINGLGDTSPGFVWRLQDESGDATGLEQPFGDGVIVNLTVWADVESLRRFTYKSEHAGFVRRRGAWFVPLDGPHLVLWWIPAGHLPTLSEAKERLDRLATEGPCPEAFLFARAFDPAGTPLRRGAATIERSA
ncbi:MAG: DUF3291 domain-containing protein [Geminicoccaceae bacterium]